MTNCKYYDPDSCSKNCIDEWPTCYLCGDVLGFAGEANEFNGYILQKASITCYDWEDLDKTLYVCPKCFEKIKALKRRKPPSSMGIWERLMWGNLRHILVGRGALKHEQDEVSERDHVQYLKTSVSEYLKCRKKYLEKEAEN